MTAFPDPNITRAAIRGLALTDEQREARLASATPELQLRLRAEMSYLSWLQGAWPNPLEEFAGILDAPWPVEDRRFTCLQAYLESGMQDEVLDWLQGRPQRQVA